MLERRPAIDATCESTTTATRRAYSFSGLSGSLDHVLANAAAAGRRRPAPTSGRHQRQRVGRTTSTAASTTTSPTCTTATRSASSDHNPEIVGIDVGRSSRPTTIQILGTNDFHGRIAERPTASAAAGAAVLAGAVKQLRARRTPNTVFAAAGDLIGASTFESFIQKDKPTIDALNEAGLEVSSVGNHEFDQGYDDLVNRVMAPYDADDQPVRWRELGVHRRQRAQETRRRPDALAGDVDQGLRTASRSASWVRSPSTCPSWSRRPASPTSRSPTSSTRSTREADDLKADGADIVVMLVHEGAAEHRLRHDGRRPDVRLRQRSSPASTTTSTRSSPATPTWRTTAAFPVQAGWRGPSGDQASGGLGRPVRHSLNQLVFTVDPATGEVHGEDARRCCR